MSGVTGSPRVPSRKAYEEILEEYKKLIKNLEGFKCLVTSGSYNSDKTKETFGDMDLVLQMDDTHKNKKDLKLLLKNYLLVIPDTIIVPFTSEKYKGRRFYNSGEIITVNFKSSNPWLPPVQIDNIICGSAVERIFKVQFLDLPAEKQGLILGLVKVFNIEQKMNSLSFIYKDFILKENQELEFNLSSVELQLRRVTYEEGTYKQKSKEVLWSDNNFLQVEEMINLMGFDINNSFEEIVKDIPNKIKHQRSINRIKGLFKSMISIKSGEVGTEKGSRKAECLEVVNNL